MGNDVKWGILATGAIAKAFARGLGQSETGALRAVASRTADKAEAFAKEFGAAAAYGSYEALLDDPEVEAVYIATPHPQHVAWAVRAAEAGKHVLVEKPMGLNQYEAQIMFDAAARHGVFMMEAFMYRCHPQTAKLVSLLREGVIGEVAVINATFSFPSSFNPGSRLWNADLAGGGIMDVGGYATSMARLIAGAARGKPFEDPVAVTGAAHLHPEAKVDAWAVGTLKFPGGIVATVATGVAVGQENVVRVYGSKGSLTLPNPWVHARDGAAPGRIVVNVQGEGGPREVAADAPVTSFALEADVCGRAIRAGSREAPAPAMSWADSLGNLRTQDLWRAAVGLAFPCERPENAGSLTAAGRPLAVRAAAPMPRGLIRHLDKPVSRLILGVDNQETMPHASAIFDDYFERGGNAFDTAHVYGAAKSRLLGRWIEARGVRDQVAVIAKGAHTPNCHPEALEAQLIEQLDWLATDHADIYLMHRDNPEVPVREFVEVLNEQVKAGRIRAFGGSNWSIERIRKANAYAKRKGLQEFSMLSNNLSLAEMVEPVWHGCIHMHDAASRRWLKRSGLAFLPWSSQARGFFVPERARPDLREDPSLVRSWYSPENFRRQERAVELAKKYGVEPINIALAWVLCQPYETFPLIGPRTIAETRSCMAALGIRLKPSEMKYLNLEDR